MTVKSSMVSNYSALFVAVIAVLAMTTSANADGDIWRQLAYGKFSLDNGTLILDHHVFSWTEACNIPTYCAWIAEITLYLIYEAFGLNGLFALRYFAMLLPIPLLLYLAKKQQSKPTAIVWLAFLLCYLISYVSGGLIKPELFSFIFMSVSVALYFAIKSGGENAWQLSYAFPLLILMWVNTHGGFTIGLVFLGIVAIGEDLNYFFDHRVLCQSTP